MQNIPLFSSDDHKFILLNESNSGELDTIRSNQYLIVHGIPVSCLIRAVSASCRASLQNSYAM